jgi:AAA15 family ATPase/GTPase
MSTPETRITLRSFSVVNFGPFAEKVKLGTQADATKKKYLEENTFENNNERYDRVTFIYGANSTGKSNYCKALLKLKEIIAFSAFLLSSKEEIQQLPMVEALLQPRNCYKLDPMICKKETKFRLELIITNVLYTYSLSFIDKQIITYEQLTRKKKRTETFLSEK